MKNIYIYAPNISKENFQGLLYLYLGCLGNKLTLELIKERKGYRAPELVVTYSELSDEELTKFLWYAFEIAKGLGGTQFVYMNGGKSIAKLEAGERKENLSDFFAALRGKEIEKIEIY
jgi:hypothetical protein